MLSARAFISRRSTGKLRPMISLPNVIPTLSTTFFHSLIIYICNLVRLDGRGARVAKMSSSTRSFTRIPQIIRQTRIPTRWSSSSSSTTIRSNSSFTGCARSRTPSHHRSRAIQTPFKRLFSSSSICRHGHLDPPKPGEERHVTFVDKEGGRYDFEVADGDNLLDIAQANDLEMEGRLIFELQSSRA